MGNLDTNKLAGTKRNGNSLTKRKLVVQIAQATGLNQQDVFTVLQQTLDSITESLRQGMHVEFREFGVFEVVTRKSRIGRNPNKPANIVRIPPRQVVKFKPGRLMRQAMMELGQ